MTVYERGQLNTMTDYERGQLNTMTVYERGQLINEAHRKTSRCSNFK